MENILRVTYGPNGPGEAMSGRPVDFAHEARSPSGRVRFRFNITSGRFMSGLSVMASIRPLPAQPPEISKLGIEPGILQAIRPPSGLIFVTGKTGSGKSTLLSSVVRHLASDPVRHEKIVEL